jgi:hypothetical protein
MESERLTRKKRIDPQLESLGWKVVPFDEPRSLASLSNCAIKEFPTDNGPAERCCETSEARNVLRAGPG